MKTTYYLLVMLAFFCFAACGETQPAKDCPTFKELPDPTADTASTTWNDVKKGLNVSFTTIDERYAKSVAPQITESKSVSVTGWKGEILSAQVLLWTVDGAKQTECAFADFKTDDGKILPASIAQARFVRYVMTDIFDGGCGYRKPENFPASLSADILDNIECFDIDAKTTRPVWITITIPRDAAEGKYKGEISITSQNSSKQKLSIELDVQAKTLPEAKDWKYHLDLWQHPSAIARVHNVKVWSDEHFEAMRPYMQLLAGAGQKVITATLNKDPWNNQCFDGYEDMITWVKKENGEWEYDYTVFDRWIQFMMDLGIKNQINCYSLVPWNNEIHYVDKKADSIINVKADPGTKIFTEIWTPFLKDFAKHVESKGWASITNIAMDERPPQMMKPAIGLVQEVAPQLGIALADNHKSYKEYPYIKDLCVAWEATVEPEDLAYRKANGLVTTYYVCCSHKFPNVFTFSNPAEAVYSAWHASALGFDGYLRWAYNSWVENPLTDSRFRTWPAGDTYIVYPEARSSIRFERLREGIQDVEKIRVLQAEFTEQNNTASLEKLQQTLANFSDNKAPEKPCQDVLNAAKLVINELSK